MSAEPVGLEVFFAELFVSELDELVEKAAGEDFGYFDFACAQRVQEEEELADGRAHVERVEGSLEELELGQSGDELEDVVLQVGLFEVAEAGAVV